MNFLSGDFWLIFLKNDFLMLSGLQYTNNNFKYLLGIYTNQLKYL